MAFFNQFRKKIVMYATTLSASTAGCFVYASYLEENQVKEDKVIDWAYPHPYSKGSKDRFVDAEKYLLKTTVWDLKKIVDRWDETDDGETWPWVWCWHNPNGPRHIFVGVDETTISKAQNIAKNPQNNLTLVIQSEQELEPFGYNLSDFHNERFAVHLSKPKQMDFDNKILMLEDERILCYDRLYIT